MSTFKQTEFRLRGFPVGESGRFPAMRDPILTKFHAHEHDCDELRLNYGMMPDSLPFTMQDNYDAAAEKQELKFDACVLENEFLKATFIPALGGRLWALYDKEKKRELLHNNSELRLGNLAIRNAWFAGGVEWNVGQRGHDEQTCSPRFTAQLADDDGTPVLRFYEMSRNRHAPFQIDFTLPDKSRYLFARVSITNPHDFEIPMYYWTNLALELTPGCRIAVPTDETYANRYEGGSHFLSRIPLPEGEGFDSTYPGNFLYVKDHFFNLPADARRFECLFTAEGPGFVLASTRQLQGRKLFVWGTSQGGTHWQRKLGEKDYLEIQGGLCKTQMECMPMPPRTTWSWVEAYGALNLPDAASVKAPWSEFRRHAETLLADALPEEVLEKRLHCASYATRPGKLLYAGSGWGALEELRRGKKFCNWLDFGQPGAEQADFVKLFQAQQLDDAPPSGYELNDDCCRILESMPEKNWKAHYFLALEYFRRQKFPEALNEILASVAREKNAWNLHAESNIHRVMGDHPQCIACTLAWGKLAKNDPTAVKEALKVLNNEKAYSEMLELLAELPEAILRRPMVRLLKATACFRLGDAEKAWLLIGGDNGGYEIPDLREGESSISQLYIEIYRALHHLPADAPVEVPYAFDIRMNKDK